MHRHPAQSHGLQSILLYPEQSILSLPRSLQRPEQREKLSRCRHPTVDPSVYMRTSRSVISV